MTRDGTLPHHTAIRCALIAFALIVVLLSPTLHAAAVTLPTGFVQSTVASGLTSPTAMQFAPDGRIFVLEQAGKVRIIKQGALLSTNFLSLSVNSAGERGLLGIAFDPDFTTNHYLYLYYTIATAPIHNRISRFTANGDVAVSGSELVLMDLDNLSTATNHNGGAMHFGPDGKLYVAVGENANGANAQSLNNRLGKILRINADGTIPTDNPFYGTATGENRAIWAYGLRNPFTFAFQPGTGRMHINDVGQNTWEEINEGTAGSNYGWPTTEGSTTNPSFVTPLYVYDHNAGCAITGGAFYNPPTMQFPSDYSGDYFFADFCSNWIRRYDIVTDTATDFATTTASSPVDLKVGSDGYLYYLARGAGAVLRISFGAVPTNTPIIPSTSLPRSPAATRPPTKAILITPTATSTPIPVPTNTPSPAPTLRFIRPTAAPPRLRVPFP